VIEKIHKGSVGLVLGFFSSGGGIFMCAKESVGFFRLLTDDVFLNAEIAIFGRTDSEHEFMVLIFIYTEGSDGLSGILSIHA
jgi:hypothetical protein